MHNSDLMAKAMALHQSGRLPEAMALYKSILSQRPNDIETLTYYGMALFSSGRFEESVAAFDQDVRA